MKVLALRWGIGKMAQCQQKSSVDQTEFHLMMGINVPRIPVMRMPHAKTFFRILSVRVMMNSKVMASVAFLFSK
jgi:hypothetical protein